MPHIRVLEPHEYEVAVALFLRSLHHKPLGDEHREFVRLSTQDGRQLGAFEGGELIGTAYSFGSALAVPGGAAVPMAAVTRVGVRADHTRRGALTALMRGQLARCRDLGGADRDPACQ
ncbi:hypothetical protein GCM10012275_47520 [Longimycelium tulufanense]|uniref:N-acetyltransferase domain-containing protein n=1 Tax=Longimycelium tulufanense TaxID=907463 RepID=A0A8J3FWF3_9PSEU|nr:GNAT family N-acetyltransferase [Longimycelium tulufanense]GGM71549.1 hypothetical protein GCM10012275_47520 [Longimycelium tulufanense]